jgi:hypothetical protein
MTAINLDQFRLQPGQTAPPKPPRRPPRHRPGERFLKGPIPWPWLERSMTLPGKALHVGLILWREAGWRRNRTVRFCLHGNLPAGLTLWAARRGLRALETAGLVRIFRKPGHGLEVSLMEASALGPDPSLTPRS